MRFAAGYATFYPCTAKVPNASMINFATNDTVANTAIVKLSSTGTLCIYTNSTTDVIIDANGYAIG